MRRLSVLFIPALCTFVLCSAAQARADGFIAAPVNQAPPPTEYDNLPPGLLMSQDMGNTLKTPADDNADQSDDSTLSVMSMGDMEAAYKKGQFAAIAARIVPIAESGYPQAQELLGIMYHYGQGFPRNPAAALEWLTKAANAGRPLAQHHLGIINYIGDGTPRDSVKALMWIYLAVAHYKDGPERTRAEQDRDNVAVQLTRRDRKRAYEMAQDWLSKHNDPAVIEEAKVR